MSLMLSNSSKGVLAHKKRPPPWDHHRSRGIGLLQGPTGGGGVLWARYPCTGVHARPFVAVFKSHFFEICVNLARKHELTEPWDDPTKGLAWTSLRRNCPPLRTTVRRYRGISLIRNTHPPRITIGP